MGFLYRSLVDYAGNVTFVAPSTWLPTGIGASLSGDVDYWQLGTSDAFYAVPAFPGGVPYPSYLTWDVGGGLNLYLLPIPAAAIPSGIHMPRFADMLRKS
jgi:hypothetical protein